MPGAEREAILNGELKRLIVVPDGPLAYLPYEALVVERAADPVYLLDVGPPIAYGPSATILYNLFHADGRGAIAGPRTGACRGRSSVCRDRCGC